MLDCSQFYNLIKSNGIDFFSVKPDFVVEDLLEAVNIIYEK
jgi:hypothetical protein